MVELLNQVDFDWYKQKLDVDGRYHHRHNGIPEKYPCKIVSRFWDDPNGPYTYNHKFFYKQEIVCKHCNHKSLEYKVDNL